MNVEYITKHVTEAVHDPVTTARHINRRCHTLNGKYDFNPNGSSIFNEDWDNLIVLDACRYDMFEDRANLPGKLESRQSLGPATYRWIRANFSDRELYDTVYITANSWFLKLQDEINAEVHSVINLQGGVSNIEYVSKELEVVTPSTVTKHAKRAANAYPNKRLIIHYLQPHHPFIGPTSNKYFNQESNSLFDVVANSGPEITRDLVRQAYKETLDEVLNEIRVLLPGLEGKTVITADHGEMLGDRHTFVPVRDYGHHRGIYNKPTVKVPWHIVDTDSRKEVIAEQPEDTDSPDMEQINEQLKNLGYKL
jgi:hypothetical protein